MLSKIIKLSLLAGFIWLGYQFIYITPDQKASNHELSTREVSNSFKEDFENISSPSELFKKDWSAWHELLLQNNQMSIRRPIKYCLITPFDCILNANVGNYMELSTAIRRRGENALKFQAKPFDKTWFGDSRIALRRQLFDFGKGDDIYFSGWFYFEGPENPKEEERINLNNLVMASFRAKNQNLRSYGEPGPSLYLSFRNYLGVRFDNWTPEIDQAHQDILNRSTMPLNEWNQIKWHLKLSDEDHEGLIEVWLNGRKIIAERGQTLPTADMKYSILEIGVGSNLNLNHDQTFYIDNIEVSPDGFSD